MSELKPKRDDEMAADEAERDAKGTAAANAPRRSTETKPHGDKLRGAFERGRSRTKH